MTKQTTSKTPYEIRLELLQMAQNHLQNTYNTQLAFATQALAVATDAQWQSMEQLKKLIPQEITFEDIISKAQELYGFVQKKD